MESSVVARGRSAVVAAAITVALVASLLAAPVAQAASRPLSPFGMTTHILGDYSAAQINRELDLVARAGGSWIRVDIPWRYVEPTNGAYSKHTLGQIDYIIAAAAKRRIRVEAVVVEFPNWSNGGKGMWVPPTDDDEFRELMEFLAARYAGRIDYWELGNEVNETEFWAVPRSSSAARYVRFLQYGYRGVKAGNPNAKVISAGLAGSDYNYLQEMYNAGARGYFDLLGVHPYTMGRSPYAVDTKRPGWTFAGLAYMKSTMSRNGDADKKIWVTEVGWQTSRVGYNVTERSQAKYTYEAYRRLYREMPYVEALFIYNSRDAGTSPYKTTHNYGLVHRNYSAKPAYSAFRKAFDAYQAVPTRLGIRMSRTSAKRGRKIVASGTLSTVPRARVKLQRRSGKRWVHVASTRTDAAGRYRVRFRLTTRGRIRYRVVFAGDRVNASAVSRTVRVRVR